MMKCWKNRTLLEKKSLATFIFATIFIIGLISLILLVTESEYCYTSSCLKASEYIHRLINPKATPCDNFYEYVCGKSIFSIQNDNTERKTTLQMVGEIIAEPFHVNDTKSLKLQKQFYQSCINLKAIDADNDTMFVDLMTKLGGWPVVSGNNWNESAFDFVEFTVNLREKGLQHDWFLDISVYSNRGSNIILEINVPDNANKIEEEIELAHVDLMIKIAVEFGANENVAKSQMPEVMYFENKLADLIDEIHNENEHLYKQKPLKLITIAEVQRKWQNINWLELINHLTKRKLSENQQVAFFAEKYMPRLDKLLKQTTKRTQVNYIMWKLVETYSPFLSRRIRDLVRNYSIVTNQPDLWYEDRKEFCLEEAKSYFQYALEAAFLRRHVTENKRKNIEEIVERMIDQIEYHFRQNEWIDENTRRVAISKLQNISYIIGGPEEMYYAEQFDKNFGAGNIEFNSSSHIIQITIDIFYITLDMLYNKKYEDTNYLKYSFYELVTSQEIVFYQNFNLLWIPAGILNEFFYDYDRPNYINYGTLGTAIAIEMIYGLYAGLFREANIWNNVTLDDFFKATACLKNCSDGLTNFKKINCDDSLLENMADYMGINLSYKAYEKWVKQNSLERKLPGLAFQNIQLFWLAHAASMCHLSTLKLNYNRSDDVTQSFRIIGPFRNSPYFSKDFRCELDTTMNPRHKCQIV